MFITVTAIVSAIHQQSTILSVPGVIIQFLYFCSASHF